MPLCVALRRRRWLILLFLFVNMTLFVGCQDEVNPELSPSKRILPQPIIKRLTPETQFGTKNFEPIYTDGKLMVGSDVGTGSEPEVLALYLSSSAVLWRHRNNDMLAATDGRSLIYGIIRPVESGFKHTLAIADVSDGHVKYDIAAPEIGALISTCFADDRILLWTPAELLSIDRAKGNLIWQLSADDEAHFSHLITAFGTIYLSDFSGTLHAIDLSTGKSRWSRRVGSRAGRPTYFRGMVYVGNDKGEFLAFDARSGTKKWQTRLPSRSWESSSVVADGVLVAAQEPVRDEGSSGIGNVYGLDLKTGRTMWTRESQLGEPGILMAANRVWLDGETIELVEPRSGEVLMKIEGMVVDGPTDRLFFLNDDGLFSVR